MSTLLRQETIRAGDPFMARIDAGQRVRLVDTEGNEAVDTFFFNAEDPRERYSAVDTVRRQRNVYLTTGTELVSNEDRTLLTIVDDTCGRHDTLGALAPRKAIRSATLMTASTCTPAGTISYLRF